MSCLLLRKLYMCRLSSLSVLSKEFLPWYLSVFPEREKLISVVVQSVCVWQYGFVCKEVKVDQSCFVVQLL